MSDFDELQRMAAMQRAAFEADAAERRRAAQFKQRLAYQSVCLDIFFSTELGR